MQSAGVTSEYNVTVWGNTSVYWDLCNQAFSFFNNLQVLFSQKCTGKKLLKVRSKDEHVALLIKWLSEPTMNHNEVYWA